MRAGSYPRYGGFGAMPMGLIWKEGAWVVEDSFLPFGEGP